MKRWIASVLAAAMLLPCIPTAGAVDAQSKEPPATGTSAYRPESLKDSGPEVVQSEEEISPDEEVTAIIVLEKKISPLARFQQKSIQNEISKNVPPWSPMVSWKKFASSPAWPRPTPPQSSRSPRICPRP